MSSLIFEFIQNHWEDILISLITGAIFYFLGRKRISEIIGSINSTDRLIILLGGAVFIVIMYILIYKADIYYVLFIILIYSYWTFMDLMRQRNNKI